jgi:hypothetical protein
MYQFQVLGTVVSSVLNYDQFTQTIGETPAINNARSTYVPCDGRSIIGSKLEQVTQVGPKQPDPKNHMVNSPDLRGRFQRGLNQFYSPGEPGGFNAKTDGDPDGARKVAEYQADDFKSHIHSENAPNVGGQGNWSFPDKQAWTSSGQRSFGATTDATGGSETRPRNVVVYFYIKIN